jgi:outer membrane protein OmpA-like peptidoglycan-associated protein
VGCATARSQTIAWWHRSGDRWEVVAEGTFERIQGQSLEAVVSSPIQNAQEHWARASVGNLYARPMAGDVVVPIEVEAQRKTRVSPLVVLNARELFSGDELTLKGEENLQRAASPFHGKKGRILVESHILRPGPRDNLRLQSELRARAVAQHLQNKMGWETEDIVTMGFGADNLRLGMTKREEMPWEKFEESVIIRLSPM